MYDVNGVYALSMSDFLNSTLIENCSLPASINFDSSTTTADWNALICRSWYIENLVNKGSASFASIDANMQSIATSITNEMRKQGTGWGNQASPEEIFARGSAFRTTVCTQFDWKWLSFPLALLALATLLLCVVCSRMLFDRQNITAWKSSLLPLLSTRNRIGDTVVAEDMSKIEKDTDKIVVSLSHSERGWEFVPEDDKDTETVGVSE
jgi:hypothetical protein